jgi:hypothetical protein
LIVYAGIVDLSQLTVPGKEYDAIRVKAFQKNPDYDDPYFDTALLLLASPLKFNSKLFYVQLF